eukprot:TRINITY_DN7809_c0_g1_i1.p1 TRINITY_DN7809_c0_g1~~TRINITY_DN7809_c0_g1_i1.p1  ORF type:complete len:229 (+),score=34.95 TRINITY_DN7809_c0_g1_i1:73-759(+)
MANAEEDEIWRLRHEQRLAMLEGADDLFEEAEQILAAGKARLAEEKLRQAEEKRAKQRQYSAKYRTKKKREKAEHDAKERTDNAAKSAKRSRRMNQPCDATAQERYRHFYDLLEEAFEIAKELEIPFVVAHQIPSSSVRALVPEARGICPFSACTAKHCHLLCTPQAAGTFFHAVDNDTVSPITGSMEDFKAIAGCHFAALVNTPHHFSTPPESHVNVTSNESGNGVS